ncbi:Alpha-1,6-glucosidase, pullulanase-type [metagenome]|uniref:Alpha-1,6-glucosidase, pullulanase-type n=1 Tax=metagenome TaxID=256318 RepID=A0A2P2C768_9ZZZZ
MSLSRRTPPAIVLALVAGALSVTALVPPAEADHTPAPTSVTLAGSLQSELGCASDWAPDCTATHLADSGDGWAATFDVPAGDYAFKVALNDAWDEAYGADGGGTDIPLVLTHDARLTFSYDHLTHQVAVAPAELPTNEVTAEDRELAGNSLRSPLTRERFYFVMADRFANGDTANDTGAVTGGRLENGFDPTDKGFFHGGDITGLTRRLDYIQRLGTTAIWLTPSFKNRAVQGTGADASAGYHGYWVTDFTTIDPHFGTNAELKTLIDRAHQRGIKVFFDIITNHTADVIDYAEGEYGYLDKATEPYRDADGVAFDDTAYAGGDTFPDLDVETSFPYTPVVDDPANATIKTPAWLNDPTNYHNRGDSTFAGESSTYGDFSGLDDLFTEQPDVVDGMTEIYQTWVDFGIDGFRIDTVKHVNLEFWQQFAPAIRAEADRIGNDDFFAFGEVFDSSPAYMSTFTTKGRLDATLDFGFQSVGTGFAQGNATTKLRDFYAADDYYTDGDSNAYSLPTFLGNHDMGRIGSFLDNTYAGDALLRHDQLAHALMYLTRGQPVVYYGDEQGFTGAGGDKDARQDMFPSQVADYNDDDLIGTKATTAVANFDTSHPLYRGIAGLARLRTRYPALANGAQLHRYASSKPGVYAFSRVSANERREYVVALNNADVAKTVTFSTLMDRGSFSQVWPRTTGRVRSDDEKRVTVTVPPVSAVVYRADSTIARRQSAPAVQFNSPSAGAVVGGARAEIAAGVPEGGFNQVTLAWRPVGADDWTALGTDDNAPYRVFHDVSAMPKGTLLEYRAIVRDSSGNLAATSTYAAVGDPSSDPGDGPGGPVTQPDAVAAAGSHNSEQGCASDWMPTCDEAQLTLDPNDMVWKQTVGLPAGSYEYKAAINRDWAENYGVGGAPNGANIAVNLPAAQQVSFYYDHRTHWITTDAAGPIVTAAGSFQSELGCPADWSPECMRSWLQDPDGDGTYRYTTTDLPAGSYEVKAAHGLSWDENYGQGGAPNGANIAFDVPASGLEVVFSYELATHVLSISTRTAGAVPDLTKAKAQWVRRGLVAWDVPDPSTRTYRLHSSQSGDLEVDAEAVTGGTSVPLTMDAAGLPAGVLEDFPQLEGYEAFRLRRGDLGKVPELLRGQLAVASYSTGGELYDATGVQVPGVLDDVYAGAQQRRLGVTWDGGRPTVSLWAPTAQEVALKVWRGTTPRSVPMRRHDDGTWTVSGPAAWKGAAYRFDVQVWAPDAQAVVHNEVTDPYSFALTTNSERSLMVDLDDPGLRPSGWSGLRPPRIAQPEDRNIYELHVRDFSIGDQSVPAAERGTYLAFTHPGAAGMTHLRQLAQAGLNTVHLLPVFDIATIEERRAEQEAPACDLTSYAPDAEDQQACVDEVRAHDGFNWGYDPYHYTTPEGSYATDPEGTARTVQFRRMVQGLNGAGLQVVMDVVYNHTASSGQGDTSVLDKIVPGYYHRLSATGAQETSTCCANTATEHAMMGKLMIDSVLTWARAYKVNGFRFDLMGHHSKQNLVDLRAALDSLTIRRDGVDGKSIYLYGEGWNFGEVADDARFVQATQRNLAGTGIGTFSDRLRDAVRGGGPFDDDPRVQGFGSGLFTDPNDSPENGSPSEQAARLLHAEDLIKLGLAGNLADFSFRDSMGDTVRGSEVDYNGQPAGYAADPSETVTYVDAHDNETLFDALQLKLPTGTSMADRVRMNTLSLSTVALSQGVVFWHAGTDLLRSKSLDRNSYDSGDWFNRIDWTGQANTFGSGLPLRGDNEAKWPYLRPLLGDPALKPGPADMAAAQAGALDLLRVRMSTPLFRLGSAALIQQKVSFLDAPPGVIAMLIDDTAGAAVDAELDGVLVVFNSTPTSAAVAATGSGWSLHPVQADGADGVVKASTVGADSVEVPARTTAVFTR